MKQRTSEWDFNMFDEKDLNYHYKQWDEPKRSTINFLEFVRKRIEISKVVIDLGCGLGASTYFISTNFKNCVFIGIDYSQKLVEKGNLIIKGKGVENLKLIQDDWFNLKKYQNIDGIISLQTLSWLPEIENPLEQIFNKIAPKWIALSSLFYDGDISIKSEINEMSIHKKCFYNTYSIPSVNRICKKFGYHIEEYIPFEIDIDITKPTELDRMSTYTITTYDKRRLQISGPLLMNWYNLLIVKS